MLELIQGESGVHPLEPSVVEDIRAACDEHGALLILDEVQTGMGRTGTLWAYERYDLRPDLMTLAKGLGGGLPIGALVTTPELGDVFAPGDHGSTFAGNPLVTAAANAALDVLDDPALLAHVDAMGALLTDGLRGLPGVTEVRGRGLMLAAEVDFDAPAFVRRALEEQALVLNATGPGTVRFIPPLVVTEDEISEALRRLAALIAWMTTGCSRMAQSLARAACRAAAATRADAWFSGAISEISRADVGGAPGVLDRRARRLGGVAVAPGLAARAASRPRDPASRAGATARRGRSASPSRSTTQNPWPRSSQWPTKTAICRQRRPRGRAGRP